MSETSFLSEDDKFVEVIGEDLGFGVRRSFTGNQGVLVGFAFGPVDPARNIPEDLTRPSENTRDLKRRIRWKCENRGGLRRSLKTAQRFTPLPGILLGNVRWRRHDLDELQASVSFMH